MTSATAGIYLAASTEDWTAAADKLSSLSAAWDTFSAGQTPPLMLAEFNRQLPLLSRPRH